MTSTKDNKTRCGKTYRFCPTCRQRHPFRGNHSKCFSDHSLCNISKYYCYGAMDMKSLPNSIKKIDYDPTSIVNGEKVRKIMKSIKLDFQEPKKKKSTRLKEYNYLEKPLPKKKEILPTNSTIECSICLSTKGNYKTLGCNHKICTSCWENILISDNLQDNCPLCRSNMFSENWDNYLFLKKNHNDRQFRLFKVDESVLNYLDSE